MFRRVETTVGLVLIAILMVALATVGGCKGRQLEEAKSEAREAKATIAKLQVRLNQIVQDHEALKDELSVVRETRDNLQKEADALKMERDDASALAEQAEQVITSLSHQAAGQTSTQDSLKKQIEELKALVAEQQSLIEELQAGVPTEPNIIDVPADPNEPVEEVEE